MSTNKTQPNDNSVDEYLSRIKPEGRREDAIEICDLLNKLTGQPPIMWGSSIVGFGTYRYQYASGREGDWMRTGFAARKNDLTIYIMSGLEQHKKLLKGLGRFKTGKSCLYIKSLDDIDQSCLIELIEASLEYMRQKYPD
ncbi:MAG: DUF1801 domain-containing protein [Gammaproteobacteria bacterium]|nr:DUF1801 domain-containing protein [Gammaproteobacteria bacterium]